MKIEEVPMSGYNAHLYKTDKYTTIHLNFLFEMEYTRENIFKADLLEEYMLNTNKIYKTKKEIHKKMREFYSMGWSLTNYNVGKKMFVELQYNFFDPTLVNDNYILDALKFAHDLLFMPRFEDGKLDSETLEVSKSMMVSHMASNLVEPAFKARHGFLRAAYPNTHLTEDAVETKEEYENILNSFTDSDLIEMYRKIFDESFVGLTIMGNVSDEFLDEVKKLFVFKNVKELDTNYIENLKIKDDIPFIKVVDEKQTESIVYAAVECENYDFKDMYAYKAICLMLTSGRLMHRVLRDELKLVYSASANFRFRRGAFEFKALIDGKNIDKCLEGFNIVLDRLQDSSVVEELLKQVKELYNIEDYIRDENKWLIEDDLFAGVFKTQDPREVQHKRVNDVTCKNVIEAAKKMKIKLVYFYEGAKK